MQEYLTFRELEKLNNERTQNRVLCKCGHSMLINNKEHRAICSHCNNFVFKTKKDEFLYRMKEKQIKRKRESNI